MAYARFYKEHHWSKEKNEEENVELSPTVQCGEHTPLSLPMHRDLLREV